MTKTEELPASRRIHILMLMCQIIGFTCTVNIPTGALGSGAIGNILCALLIFATIGIPLFYMETVVSQFTGRDCIDVWTIRKCFSHMGYVQVLWQILFVIYNHAVISFLLYYFLISFEKPVPYYICGPWSTRDCNILSHNYTVNEDCIKRQYSSSYCDHLYTTYPEYQFWRYYILDMKNKGKYLIVWRVCLASGLACGFTYLSCFRKTVSIKYFLNFLSIFPIFVYILLLAGSMFQKGIVVKYGKILDLDFEGFSKKFRLSNLIQQIIFTLTIGTGITFNFASSTNFRSPCYSNIVVCVCITAAFNILTICTTAMLYCPYAYHYSADPDYIIRSPMTLLFEKVPRIIRHYTNSSIWLLLIFSSNVIIGLNTNVIAFYNLLELVTSRNPKMAKYPGLLCLCAVILLFIFTIPLQSRFGMNIVLVISRVYLNLLSTFIGIIECIIFIFMYGIHRFGEDIHFMQGVQTTFYMKLGWMFSFVVLLYSFCNEIMYRWSNNTISDFFGLYLLIAAVTVIILGAVINIVLIAVRENFRAAFEMDPTWGPKSEILQRSRAMFTAQAMTKEYMYRQYHLQAGITARQRMANRFWSDSLREEAENNTEFN